MTRIPRPLATEYPAYFGNYIKLVHGGDALDILARQGESTIALLEFIGDDGAEFRYADDKWSIKEMIGHLIDTERLFVYRAMSFARGDTTILPGMSEQAWEATADHDALDLGDLLDEFWLVRAGTIRFFENLNQEDLARRGRADNKFASVSSIAWVIAGHEMHHRLVLDDRYLTEG
jgi:uncharacterized damage-inducible protein DinB